MSSQFTDLDRGTVTDGNIVIDTVISGGLNSDPGIPVFITKTASISSQYNDVVFNNTNVYIAVQEYNNVKGCVYTSDLALTAVTKTFEDTLTSQFNSIGVYQNSVYVCGKAQINQTINNTAVPTYVSYILKIDGTTITRLYDPVYTIQVASPGYYYSSELYNILITTTGNIYACGYILEKQIQGTGVRYRRGYVIKTNSSMDTPILYYLDQNIGGAFKYISIVDGRVNMFGTNGTNPYSATLESNNVVNSPGEWTSAYSYTTTGGSVMLQLRNVDGIAMPTSSFVNATINFYDGYFGAGNDSSRALIPKPYDLTVSYYASAAGSLLKSTVKYDNNITNFFGFAVGYLTQNGQNFGHVIKFYPNGLVLGSATILYSDPVVINNTVTNISVQIADPPCFVSCSVLTDNGYMDISNIKNGDYVISAFTSAPVRVLHCGYCSVDLKNVNENNHPLLVKANHFKDGIPNKDTVISGYHRVICPGFGDNNYIAIHTYRLGDFKRLNNEEVLSMTGLEEVRYYHIEVEGGKNAVFCDGIPVETLDKGEWDEITKGL
jgi:hypothetical protein